MWYKICLTSKIFTIIKNADNETSKFSVIMVSLPWIIPNGEKIASNKDNYFPIKNCLSEKYFSEYIKYLSVCLD